MSPIANAGKLIWEMLALAATVVTLSLLAYEIFLGRRLAKARQGSADARQYFAEERSKTTTRTLTKSPIQEPTTALSFPGKPRVANKAW